MAPSDADSFHGTLLDALVSAGWFENRATSRIFVAAYRASRLRESDFVPSLVDLGNSVRVAFVHGSFPFMDASKARLRLVDEHTVDVGSGLVPSVTEEGPTTFIATPSARDGQAIPEPEYRDRIDATVGLLLAWEGRNAAFARLFDQEITADGSQTTVTGPVVENPFVFLKPDLSDERLRALRRMAQALDRHAPNDRARVDLSMRWYERGVYGSGVDAFLQLWIAIETLCMPTSTDIEPFVDLLAARYATTPTAIMERFQIGRIFGLRGRIVHRGDRRPIHGDLLALLASLYSDALGSALGEPTPLRAAMIADKEGFDVRAHLP